MKGRLQDMVVLSLFGPIMFLLGDLALEFLPNVHLVGALLVVITAVYRTKALFALYVYVFLAGLYGGFSLWWIPYLYIWLFLWGAVMLIPRRLPTRGYFACLIAAGAAHGYLFGILYAPAQMLLFDFGWKRILAWIVAGLPFDAIHGTANLILGLAIVPPLVTLLQRLKTTREL